MPTRRELLLGAASGLAVAGCARPEAPLRLKVGILHSRTGAMSASELPVAQATRYALGGVVGPVPREAAAHGPARALDIEVLEGDGASTDEGFEREAVRLADAGASVIFGCWTSSSRKRVIPVLAERKRLLVYPLQYEGVERSENVLYTGSTPNQQMLPALRWAAARYGKRSFFVGSDYVFPRVANEVMADGLRAMGSAPVGVAYLPLAAEPAEMARLAEALVAQIEASGAEVVYSTLNGTPGNFAFFEALRARRPVESLPSVSFSIGEPEAAALAAAGHRMDGEHVSWTWMEGHGIPAHAALRAELKAAIGRDEPVSDPMFSAIAGVRLWARAASRMESGVDDANALLHAMAGTEVVVGGQSVIVDRENHHVWKPNHIGRFRPDGSLEAVSSMDEPAQAVPFPGFRTEAAWERLTAGLAGPHPG